jgi:hypothetical protein
MTENNGNLQKSVDGFHISNGPVVRLGENKSGLGLGEVVELPRVYGERILFAIARDPHTIFTYWNIDWPAIFAKAAPVDRQVHLRVYKGDGAQETSAAVEPMAGNCYLTVSQPREQYHVEIGYYQPKDVWHSVATSENVAMPPDSVAPSADVDVATIPYHLSFQRLIDLFRAANGDALAEIISRLQRRAVSEEDRELLSPEEWEILRAMNLSLDEIGLARRAFMDRAGNEKVRKRAEAILGFGSTSPGRGFGGSSWGESSRV